MFLLCVDIESRNPNGDAAKTSKHSIDLESLKHLGSNSNSLFTESLPAPSLLSSSTVSILKSSQQQQETATTFETSPSIRTITNNQNSTIITKFDSNDGRFDVLESIHHSLSSAKSRYRRSLSVSSSNGNLIRRLISKRFIVKRNFPNNQLSKTSSVEMNADDSNEMELGEKENDDYVERAKDVDEEDGKTDKKQQILLNGHDRLDDDDENESDLQKSMKLFVPYWDAYDTVNQLFLEISEYLHNVLFYLRVCTANGMIRHHLLVILFVF